MKIGVSKNRNIYKDSDDAGTENENNFEVLEFTFPEELENYIKYIEIEAENEEGKLKYVDRIENNRFTLSNSLTKYDELKMQVVGKEYIEKKFVTVFKSNIFNVTVDNSLNIMEDVEVEQMDLLSRIEANLQEVYYGMEEFKTEIVEDANSRFNTNVTEKTQTFNTNAETKTTDFNNNYDTKLNVFNSNYDEKLGTFNTNATNKLDQYNNNDTAKTETYNTNATEKLNTYNTNATSKVAEYNTNAEAKLNAYNTNATQKLAEYDSLVTELHEDLDETQAKVEQYNTNIDTKYTQYNTNATEKLNTYNSNATTKTNAYNTNAQTKLEAYNTNATAKTTAYNENAEEKLEEYNENASALMQSVETLEQKHDTEVAELQAEITDLQTDLEMATDLIPTDTATGSDITVNDSARYYFKKFEVEGKSEQETYTGKNKLNVPESLTFTRTYSILDTPILAGTYKLTFDSESHGGNNYPVIRFMDNNISETLGTVKEKTITLNSDETRMYIYANADYASSAGIEATIKKLMVSVEGGVYEPFTNGQPAPNSDYECPIQNVTGDVEVKVENDNIFDVGIDNSDYVTNSETLPNYLTVNDKQLALVIQTNGSTCVYRKQNFQGNKDYSFKAISSKASGRIYIRIRSLDNTRWLTDSDLNISGFTYNAYYKGWFLQFASTNMVKTFSIPNCLYWQLGLGFASEDVGSTQTISNIQLVEGAYTAETMPDYEAHKEQTVTFPLSEGQVLHEGDTIEDKIVQRRYTLVLNGTEDGWLADSSAIQNLTKRFVLTKHSELGKNGSSSNALCNFFTQSTVSALDKESVYYVFANDATYIAFRISVDKASTLEEFKSWLAQQYANGTPVTLEYELETPIETEFTQAQRTAKTQIDKLYSYKGTTYITSEANLNVIYRKDPSLAEEQQNSKLEELEARIVLLEG